MDRQQARHDDRDNSRALRWGIVGVLAVLVAVLVYNFTSFGRGDPRVPDSAPAATAPAATSGSASPSR